MDYNAQTHWNGVYETKDIGAVSWYQDRATTSLALIASCKPKRDAAIFDAGSGASSLIGDLLDTGYHDITALDVSRSALDAAREQLGERAALVKWMESDITNARLPENAYDIWHDRAVFHFLIEPEDRRNYARIAGKSIKRGGYLIVATFAFSGPEQCSGLPIVRYNAEALAHEFATDFHLNESRDEIHLTPWGSEQRFIYCKMQRV